VGENVTPTLTLAKVVSCQQGLRANAEDVFRWHTIFVNDIEPELLLIQSEADTFRKDISNVVQNLAQRVYLATIIVSFFFLLLMIIFIRASITLYKTKDNLKASLDEANRLAAIIEQSFEGVMIMKNPECQYVYINSAWEKMTGWSRNEIIGKVNRQLVKSDKHDQAFYKKLWDTVLAGKTYTGEIINKRKDGTLYDADIIIIPIKNHDGNIVFFAEIARDITAKKKVEREIIQRTSELERMNKLMVGREIKMMDLKEEIKRLKNNQE